MDYACITITKRDGSKENFSIEKIERAIAKAYRADGMNDDETSIKQVTAEVAAAIDRENISVEEIQDLVERKLMMRNPSVAKKFIIYREWRTKEREKRTSMKQVMDGIVAVEKNDVNLSNANMSSHTPAGQMMTFASEVTKDYAYKYLVGVRYGRAHREGDTFTTSITIPPRRPLAYNMIWRISSTGDSIPRTVRCVRRSPYRVMPRWLPSFSRPTKMSNTAGNPFRLSTILWRRAS